VQVEVKEIVQKQTFKPVQVVLNFENKEDFRMFFEIVGYNESIPALVAKGAGNYEKDYEHCQHLLTAIHRAMRQHENP
jgi:hypothetical protein